MNANNVRQPFKSHSISRHLFHAAVCKAEAPLISCVGPGFLSALPAAAGFWVRNPVLCALFDVETNGFRLMLFVASLRAWSAADGGLLLNEGRLQEDLPPCVKVESGREKELRGKVEK